jgi:hypothetical protein
VRVKEDYPMPTTRRRARSRVTTAPLNIPEGTLQSPVWSGTPAMGTSHGVRGRKTTARSASRAHRTTTGAQHFAIPRNVLNDKNLIAGLTNFVGLLDDLGVWGSGNKAGVTPQMAYGIGLRSFGAQST